MPAERMLEPPAHPASLAPTAAIPVGRSTLPPLVVTEAANATTAVEDAGLEGGGKKTRNSSFRHKQHGKHKKRRGGGKLNDETAIVTQKLAEMVGGSSACEIMVAVRLQNRFF